MPGLDDIPVAERRALAELKAELTRTLGERVRGLLLFGSLARGRYSEESDVDVLVLIDHRDETAARRVIDAAVAVMLRHPHVVISPLLLTPEELAALRARERRLALDIDREGIPL